MTAKSLSHCPPWPVMEGNETVTAQLSVLSDPPLAWSVNLTDDTMDICLRSRTNSQWNGWSSATATLCRNLRFCLTTWYSFSHLRKNTSCEKEYPCRQTKISSFCIQRSTVQQSHAKLACCVTASKRPCYHCQPNRILLVHVSIPNWQDVQYGDCRFVLCYYISGSRQNT